MTREELEEDTTAQVALVVTTENYTSLSVRCVTVESGKVRSRGPGSREPFLPLRHPLIVGFFFKNVGRLSFRYFGAFFILYFVLSIIW